MMLKVILSTCNLLFCLNSALAQGNATVSLSNTVLAAGTTLEITCVVNRENLTLSVDQIELYKNVTQRLLLHNSTGDFKDPAFESRLTLVTETSDERYLISLSNVASDTDIGTYFCKAKLSDDSDLTSPSQFLDVIYSIPADSYNLLLSAGTVTASQAPTDPCDSPVVVPLGSTVELDCQAFSVWPNPTLTLDTSNITNPSAPQANASPGSDHHNVSVTATFSADTRGEVSSATCNLDFGGHVVQSACIQIEVDPEDGCAADPCQNNGTCTDTVGGFECACTPCNAGNDCSQTKTGSCDMCQNGGTCVSTCTVDNNAEKFTNSCNCDIGYGGDTCATACDNVISFSTAVSGDIGSKVTLQCQVKDNVTLSWQREASAVILGTDSDLEVTVEANPVDYHCVTTDASDCMQKSTVTVSGSFVLISPNKTITENKTVDEDDEVVLKCEATGRPDPVLHWRRLKEEKDENGTVIGAQWVVLTNNSVNTSTHTIESAQMEDIGQYVCEAQNAPYDIMVVHLHVEEDDDDGLETWQLILIIVAAVLLIAIIVFVIILLLWIFVFKKKGSICPSDKGATSEGTYKQESRPTDPEKGRKPVLYPTTESEKRALPETRGGALPPLDVDGEKQRMRKKKKKNRYADEDEPRGYSRGSRDYDDEEDYRRDDYR